MVVLDPISRNYCWNTELVKRENNLKQKFREIACEKRERKINWGKI